MQESRSPWILPAWKSVPLVLIYAFFLESGLLPAAESAEPAERGDFVNRIYQDERGQHRYAVFVPADYTPDREWPVIVWLHGASARGRDGRSILVAGLGPNVHFRRATFPFIVVFPQCENLRSRLLGGWTDQREDADRALKILEAVEQEYRVDPQRRVLAGVSMGAFGVWSIAARTSDMWAAMVPVSGGGPLTIADNLKHIPVWAFHAQDDQVVPPEASQTLVNAINERGGRAYYSELPSGGHNIGSRVFAQDDIYTWLLDPKQEPQQQFNWSIDRHTTSDLQREVPFVPGAEVDNSVLVHLGTDVLQAFSQAIPGQVPPESMQGSQGGQSQMAGSGFMRFQVSVAGIQYSGQIQQARLEPMPDNQLRFWLGIQPLTMNVLGTEIQGRLLRGSRADADRDRISTACLAVDGGPTAGRRPEAQIGTRVGRFPHRKRQLVRHRTRRAERPAAPHVARHDFPAPD
ncbi:MAG: alpha/beta hydrolase-fold protein [Planctomycetaceae bacterium]